MSAQSIKLLAGNAKQWKQILRTPKTDTLLPHHAFVLFTFAGRTRSDVPNCMKIPFEVDFARVVYRIQTFLSFTTLNLIGRKISMCPTVAAFLASFPLWIQFATMPRTKFSAGSHEKKAHTILKRPRDDKAKRMYQHMKDAKLENLDACHLWTMFSALKVSAWVRRPSEQAVEDVLVQFLLTYFIGREAIRLCRASPHPDTDWCTRVTFQSASFQTSFLQYLHAENPAKKHLNQAVTMLQGFSVLQLHNNFMQQDPYFIALFDLYLKICEVFATTNRMCVLRTMFLCIQGRSMDVLHYCAENLNTCLSPAHLHAFIMCYDGPCGDGSTLDTLKLQPVGTCSNCLLAAPVLASWREHKENFEQILDTTSPSIALSSLQSMPGWRGTGFRATTLLRCLYSLDVERRKHLPGSQLVFPAANNLSTLVSVGPNPRCLLNLWKGNPWRSNKNSTDAGNYLTWLDALRAKFLLKLPDTVLIDGVPSPLLRPDIGDFQFSMCMATHMARFCLTGKLGRRARKTSIHVLDCDSDDACE